MSEALASAIHAFDPAMAPDSEFEPGQLHHLAPGNAGRMLDRRRTPVRVLEVRTATGQWVAEVTGFEDAGARWVLPLESVAHYQFANGSPRADEAEVARMRAAVRAFNRPGDLPPNHRRRAATRQALQKLAREAGAWLKAESRFLAAGGTLDIRGRSGHPLLVQDLEAWMKSRELWDLEEVFAATLVSHPASNEVVKGHAMALAYLGLAGYAGTIARDPETLAGPWAIERRARHILVRLAFVRELLAAVGIATPVLYRAVSSEEPIAPRPPASFVHATFSLEVAMSLFGPEWEGRSARLERQAVPATRVFMTYLETAAMNRQFREAEAVLIADPANPMF